MPIVAVCRLAILKRMPTTLLTLLVEHRVREQVKVQVQRSGKMKIWGWFPNPQDEYTEFAYIIYQNPICPSMETDFIPESHAETLPPSKYGRKRARIERDNCVSRAGQDVFLI